MKYPAKMIVMFTSGGAHNSYFSTIEEVERVLDAFSVALAKVREFANRDEEVVFRFRGAGAAYAIDLRKVAGASVEYREEWAEVSNESWLHQLQNSKNLRQAAKDRDLNEELELAERLQIKTS